MHRSQATNDPPKPEPDIAKADQQDTEALQRYGEMLRLELAPHRDHMVIPRVCQARAESMTLRKSIAAGADTP